MAMNKEGVPHNLLRPVRNVRQYIGYTLILLIASLFSVITDLLDWDIAGTMQLREYNHGVRMVIRLAEG